MKNDREEGMTTPEWMLLLAAIIGALKIVSMLPIG